MKILMLILGCILFAYLQTNVSQTYLIYYTIYLISIYLLYNYNYSYYNCIIVYFFYLSLKIITIGKQLKIVSKSVI